MAEHCPKPTTPKPRPVIAGPGLTPGQLQELRKRIEERIGICNINEACRALSCQPREPVQISAHDAYVDVMLMLDEFAEMNRAGTVEAPASQCEPADYLLPILAARRLCEVVPGGREISVSGRQAIPAHDGAGSTDAVPEPSGQQRDAALVHHRLDCGSPRVSTTATRRPR